ncbi:MAG: nickel pincer cofactor biosynthesis protein LarC [Lachnospiraceae bacterium]|nr:nickel pincer cofactor biosynthesis protein LarC [Lachnospiraceae bacterium]
MSKLYLECTSGISGDMFVAALLDLGADAEVLQKVLKTVPVQGFEVKISRVKKMGLDVCDFDVIVDAAHENHDHDMEYLYGNLDGSLQERHEHHHVEEDAHRHEHHHEHHHEQEEDGHRHEHHHEHHHEHRGMHAVMEIIENTEMTEGAKHLARRIFTILGEAEAKAHGTSLDTVHFHEVGAVDSIVDIISAAVCMDNLGIREVIVPVLYEGSGRIRCQHGILPVPVPAVANIVAQHGLKLHITGQPGELVTPTGAAIVAAVRTEEQLPETFQIIKTGLGAGKRNYEHPSIVRAMLIVEENQGGDCIYKLETNIDDCTGENLGYVMERLLQAGAKDVHYVPVFMKKNRPAYQLNVICDGADVERMEQIIFFETTTIGIRRFKVERSVLERTVDMVDTPYGTAKVKHCQVPEADGTLRPRNYPEYEDVAALAKRTGMSFRDSFQAILNLGCENHK